MVKHTQTIRQQITDELFECVWPFCEIGAKGLRNGLDQDLWIKNGGIASTIFHFPINHLL